LNDHSGRENLVPATPDQIEPAITEWITEIPEEPRKEHLRKLLLERLTTDPAKHNTAALGEVWLSCENESRKVSQEEFDFRHVAILREVVCDASSDGAAIGRGVARIWIRRRFRLPPGFVVKDLKDERREYSAKLARALLGDDGQPCAPAKDYDDDTRTLLREAAGLPPVAIAPK
jgi:hypothetical protein